jgi:hypothetical protein
MTPAEPLPTCRRSASGAGFAWRSLAVGRLAMPLVPDSRARHLRGMGVGGLFAPPAVVHRRT